MGVFNHKAALFAAALLTAAPAWAETAWILPSAYPPSNFHSTNLAEFAADVKEATGGEVTITLHPGASLFKAPDIKRAVQTGQAQAGEVILSLHENENPLFGLDVIPFLATSFADAKTLWQVSRPKIEAAFDAQGLKILYAVPWPPQGIFVKKDLAGVEDLKGLKWRAYNVGTARIAEIVGAQAVTVQEAELAQALATGAIEGMMTSSATGVDRQLWESMSHFYDVQAWLPKNVVFVSKRAFEALSPEQEAAVLAAAAEAETRGFALSEEKTRSYLATLAENGIQVLPPGERLAADFAEIGDTLTDAWLEKAGDDGAAIIEAYRAAK